MNNLYIKAQTDSAALLRYLNAHNQAKQADQTTLKEFKILGQPLYQYLVLPPLCSDDSLLSF